MPTVSVGRDRLFQALGRTYTQEEFEELCFDFGIELDDVTTEKAIIRKEKHLKEEEETAEDEEVIYKIEIPANRYDLLCLEGIVQSLRIFLGLDSVPQYRVCNVGKESMLKMHVEPKTSMIRPYVVCAVLRGITFDDARYNNFIDLQDKLHQNICRSCPTVLLKEPKKKRRHGRKIQHMLQNLSFSIWFLKLGIFLLGIRVLNRCLDKNPNTHAECLSFCYTLWKEAFSGVCSYTHDHI